MAKVRILVYGDVEMDVLLKTGSAFTENSDTIVEEMTTSPGGSAANSAVIAASFGVQVTLIGSIGNDDWGRVLLQDLKHHHVHTRFVKQVSGKSGVCIGLLDGGGDKRFLSYRGVNESNPPDLPADAIWQDHTCLHLSGYSFQTSNSRNTATALMGEAKRHRAMVSLDPSFWFAKQPASELDGLLSQIDLLFPNQEEAALMSGYDDPLESARALIQRGVDTVVVTLGNNGCLLVNAHDSFRVNLTPVAPVVDTTGAGDAFCGGYLTGRVNGFKDEEACRLGCAAAAHIVTKHGAHQSPPILDELTEIFEFNHETEMLPLLKRLSLAKSDRRSENYE